MPSHYYSEMKWNRFIVEASTNRRETSPISHLDSSRRSSRSQQAPFALKSCEKVPLNTSEFHNRDFSISELENIHDPTIRKMISRVSVK
jgi:hypothetical protein